jgi:hypothetical protein
MGEKFSFLTTFTINFLQLLSDLKKGKLGKNISLQYRQQPVVEKYLRNKAKIAVILFC